LPLDDALTIGAQVADALHAAHQKSIIHRDIKPANVKLTPDGRVKVLDFGLAKRSWQAPTADEVTVTELSELGRIVGTPGYMSPEQVRGKPVDHRTDIWACGCVLYELLTGKRTFRGETSTDTLAAILEREPAWELLPASTPIALRELVERCLEKNPGKRVQSAAELGAALRRIQQSPRRVWRATSLRRGNARRVTVVLGVLAAIATAAAGAYRMFGRDSPGDEGGVVASVTRPLTSLPGWEFTPGWSSDGAFIAFSNNVNGSMDVFASPATGGDPIWLTKSPADETSPRWSPDGQTIAFAADHGAGTNIYVIPSFGGAERKVAETGVSALLRFLDSVALIGATPWSPDGKELLFSRVTPPGDTAIWRVNVESGALTQVTFPAAGEQDFTGTWSPDGARIAFNRRQGGRETIWTMPTAGGEPSVLVADELPAFDPAWSGDSQRVVYVSPRAGAPNLWEKAVDSGRLRQITTGPGWDLFPTISRTGRLGYGLFSHQVDLYATPANGQGDPRRLTQHTGESFHPSVSPDGRTVVYQSDRSGNNEIWKLDLETNLETRLTNNDAADVAPDWSPVADEIAFVSTRGGKPQVWVMDADGRSARLLTDATLPGAGGGWTDGQVIPRWSPDGQSIAYVAVTERGNELWRANRDGSNARSILGGVLYFDWFRDSRHIVFSSEANTAAEISALDLETGEQTVLLKEPAIELAVSRAAGEPTLLYTQAASHFGMNLFRLVLRASPSGMPRVVGTPVQVTNGRAEWHAHKGQWTPDGKTIIYTRDADQGNLYTVENYK
jgi:Tol biopolymer transport system component